VAKGNNEKDIKSSPMFEELESVVRREILGFF
jgi:hypothetical protein